MREYEDERCGTANLFVMVEPLAGWRHVAVTARRTAPDYAVCLRYLVEERYPDGERIYLLQDNPNTHTASALDETFPPAQARSMLDRLDFHPTPERGGWSIRLRSRSVSSGVAASPVPYRAPLPSNKEFVRWKPSATIGMLPLSSGLLRGKRG